MRRRASGTAGKSILKMALPAVLLSVSCEPQLPSRPKEVPCVPQQVSSVAKADSDRTDGGVKKEKNCPEVECPKEKCPPADFIKEIIRVATDTNTVPEVREELVVLLAKLLEAQSFGFSISSIQGPHPASALSNIALHETTDKKLRNRIVDIFERNALHTNDPDMCESAFFLLFSIATRPSSEKQLRERIALALERTLDRNMQFAQRRHSSISTEQFLSNKLLILASFEPFYGMHSASDKNPENFLLSTSSRIRIFEKISKSHFSMSVAVECTALAQWEKTTPQQRKKLELIIKRNLEVLPPTFYERGIAKGMLEFIQSGETLPLPEICEYRKKMLQPL